jgi:hypothetical protein
VFASTTLTAVFTLVFAMTGVYALSRLLSGADVTAGGTTHATEDGTRDS